MTQRRDGPTEHVRALGQRPRRSRPEHLVVASWHVEASGEALGQIRAAIREQAQSWRLDEEDTYALLLITIELVTNAIEHARTPCLLAVRRLRSVVRITVADRSTDLPQVQAYDVHAVRGRGLQMVDALTTRWGWSRVRGGKAVWATLSVSNSPTPAARTADRSPAQDQETPADADREHQQHRTDPTDQLDPTGRRAGPPGR